MKRFDIITEADARVLPRGETVMLARGGHITPLARDTLKDRRVMAASEVVARYSREHNGANVLALGSSLVSDDEARAIVTTWLTTPMQEPRYIRRLAKIRELEQEN